MATRRWLGHAADIKQVDTLLIGGGPWVAGDTITLTIDNIDLVITLGTLITTAQVATTIKQAFAGETFTDTTATVSPSGGGVSVPQFGGSEIVASVSASTVTFTGARAGVPFTMTAAKVSAAGTITYTNVTVATGKNWWSNADNWSGNAVPVAADDVYFEEGNVDCLYGLAQSAVTLTSLSFHLRYTGKVGLPNRNANGYSEYRATYLAISATTVNLGTGAGTGSGRIKLNTGAVQTAVFVFGMGKTAETGLESLLWIGTHASNAVNVQKGSVGIAVLPGETANVSGGLRVGQSGGAVTLFGGAAGGSDAAVRCGSNVTIATVTMDAGSLTTDGAVTTLTLDGGTVVAKSGNITTATIASGAALYYLGVGTITTANVSGRLDFSRDLRARTLSNCTVFRGYSLLDPTNSVVFTNGIIPSQCEITDGTLKLGPNRKVTPA